MEMQITEIANGTSVMQRVKEFATANKTFTLAEVCKAHPGAPKNQLSTALWKLRKAGAVAKDDAGVYTVLTDVNKPVEVKAKAKAKPKKRRIAKNVQTIEDMRQQLSNAAKEILHWNKVAKDMTEKAYLADKLNTQLEDALAIIRYLESKLYVALQMVAKNGSNS
jgi:putative protein kinase ArgK-like GTPase of G3E family